MRGNSSVSVAQNDTLSIRTSFTRVLVLVPDNVATTIPGIAHPESYLVHPNNDKDTVLCGDRRRQYTLVTEIMLKSFTARSLSRYHHHGGGGGTRAISSRTRSYPAISNVLDQASRSWTCHDGPMKAAKRNFSDRLLGYSPMAPTLPNPTSTTPNVNEDGTPIKRIPTAQDVTTSGGVWAPTSAKRDKLGELRVALQEGQESLDDAATTEQRLDLYLADGIRLLAQTTDSVSMEESIENVPALKDLSEWLVREQGRQPEYMYDEPLFTAHLDVVSEKITSLLADVPTQSLEQVRDFLDPEEAIVEEISKLKESDIALQDASFQQATLRLRLLLAKAATEHAKASWKILTTVSDADVDRAAVKGDVVPPQAVSLANLYKYIFSHASGTCSDRVDAAWALLDRDEDGLLDESEMHEVAFLCVTPVQVALNSLFQDALEVAPAREPLAPIGTVSTPEQATGWRQRRKEKKVKKLLLKMFQNSTKNHFLDEVEINHRLRCIYAWAEKEHQNNKLDSVLVDEGWTGRKRYVELSPKISLAEFREVQKEHFTHLDRIGKEILKSFREDLWVQQGKGRERAELIRDCLAFLTVVSIADYFILMS